MKSQNLTAGIDSCFPISALNLLCDTMTNGRAVSPKENKYVCSERESVS